MKPKKTKRVPEDTLRIFPQTPQRDAGSGKTYDTFVSEMAEVMEAYNKGQKYERMITKGLKRKGMGGEGVLGNRGADANIKMPNGKTYSMGIKGEGAASGQAQFEYHPKKGWHVTTKGSKGRKFAKALNDAGIGHLMQSHFGTPKGKTKADHVAHVHAVIKKKGELNVPLDTSAASAAKIIRHGMNDDHMVHIQGKGTFALNHKVSSETGLPHIRKHINTDASPIVARFRSKPHSTTKSGKRSRSNTVQLSLDVENGIEKSDFDLIRHGLKKRISEEAFVPLDFSTPEAAARSMKEMERRRGAEAREAEDSNARNRRTKKPLVRIKPRPTEGSETK